MFLIAAFFSFSPLILFPLPFPLWLIPPPAALGRPPPPKKTLLPLRSFLSEPPACFCPNFGRRMEGGLRESWVFTWPLMMLDRNQLDTLPNTEDLGCLWSCFGCYQSLIPLAGNKIGVQKRAAGMSDAAPCSIARSHSQLHSRLHVAPSGQAVPAVLFRRTLIKAIKDSKKTARRAEESGLRQGRRSAQLPRQHGSGLS